MITGSMVLLSLERYEKLTNYVELALDEADRAAGQAPAHPAAGQYLISERLSRSFSLIAAHKQLIHLYNRRDSGIVQVIPQNLPAVGDLPNVLHAHAKFPVTDPEADAL